MAGNRMSIPVLAGSAITLRQLRLADTESIQTQANDRRVTRFMQTLPYPYTLQHARSWINRSRRLNRKREALHLGIVPNESEAAIGGIGLLNIHPRNKNAELGYWLGKKYWRRGYTEEAVQLILRLAFKELRLHRVYAVVAEPNIASVKLLEKCGFTQEGTWRQACRLGNRWYGVFAFGILKNEFRQ